MVVTTTSITAVSVSTRSAQSTLRSPDAIQVMSCTRTSCPNPTLTKAIQDRIIEVKSRTVVISSAEREPAAGASAAWACVVASVAMRHGAWP